MFYIIIYKLQIDKVRHLYVDSRYKSSDPKSDNNSEFEIKETPDLPENTICYIDDIPIPHTWSTIEQICSRA